ncbi:TPA: biopolymer transporter ExbD [Candidatus Galligastranaerophilus faecipullorum]|nr:biopolymer transporter ExbD [Candidatus Galligastranaerophilus faecipullorum]
MAIKLNADGKKPVFNEINITPLTDIFLVLLIIMMVIAPSFQTLDKNITIPEINSGVSIEEKNATVSLTKEGEMFLNGERTDENSLEADLAALIGNLEKKEVVVKADEKAKSSDIMKIMRSAQNAGFEKLVVAGEPLSKKEQRELKRNGEEQ